MRYFIASLFLTGLVVGCAASSGDATSETTSTAAVNDHCPIMGGEVTAKGGSTEWNDKTIGFCCPGCEPKWEALSDEEKAQHLAAADEASHDSHDHAAHEHS